MEKQKGQGIDDIFMSRRGKCQISALNKELMSNKDVYTGYGRDLSQKSKPSIQSTLKDLPCLLGGEKSMPAFPESVSVPVKMNN